MFKYWDYWEADCSLESINIGLILYSLFSDNYNMVKFTRIS